MGDPRNGHPSRRTWPRYLGRTGPLCTILLALASRPAHASKTPAFTGDVRLEIFHTTDLFPGGLTPEPDDGMRLTFRPEWNARVGHAVRTKLWAKVALERYRRWPDADVTDWDLGLDLKRGPHRLRLYAGTTPNELYFPSSAGGAFLDRMHVGTEVRAGLHTGWFADGGIEYEREDFVPNYNERDADRWTAWLGATRELAPGRRFELQYRFRRQDSVTNLYTYGQNLARLDAEWATTPLSGAIRVEYALRDYRTGVPSASNFGREDNRWRLLARVHRRVVGPLEAEVADEWRNAVSTRASKNYVVNTVGFALTVSR